MSDGETHSNHGQQNESRRGGLHCALFLVDEGADCRSCHDEACREITRDLSVSVVSGGIGHELTATLYVSAALQPNTTVMPMMEQSMYAMVHQAYLGYWF